jgi:hypothetical protein
LLERLMHKFEDRQALMLECRRTVSE